MARPLKRLWWSWLPSITRNSLAFGAASFSSSVLCTLFALYSTPVFTSLYQISDSHFYASHVVFAVWNAINDPAFAWLIDNTTASGADRRLPAIKYGGPLWCLAFLIPWWPWTSEAGSWLVGVHFCFSICVFDSFLTYVLLVHCALLADLTTDNTLRNNYNNVGSLLGVAGGAAAAASYHLYDGNNMAPFRLFCLYAAGVSSVGFWYTGTRLDLRRLDSLKKQPVETGGSIGSNRVNVDSATGGAVSLSALCPSPPTSNPITTTATRQQQQRQERNDDAFVGRSSRPSAGLRARSPDPGPLGEKEDGNPLLGGHANDGRRGSPLTRGTAGGGAEARGGRDLSFWGFAKQLATHKNFWLYVSMNFVENFNALFDQSFFVFLDTKLFKQALPSGAHGMLTVLCLYLPKIMTQVLTPVADRFGTYRLILYAATFKLVASLAIFTFGGRAWPVWAILFLGNRLAATVWGFYNLSFSDVIDEDTLRNRRPESMSVSVHGLQALFVKPAQSLAPVLGMYFLPRGALKRELTAMSPDEASRVRQAAFTILWSVPAVCGAIQVLIWRAYRLHGSALKDMKERLREWERWLNNEHHLKTNILGAV